MMYRHLLVFAPPPRARFGELVRHMWHPRMFKAHVSPEELVQAVSTTSKKRFVITQQSDPSEFLVWLLNQLHKELGGTKKSGSSIIHRIFQGQMKVWSKKIKRAGQEQEGKGKEGAAESAAAPKEDDAAYAEQISQSPFLWLTLDLPTTPLFKDESEKNIIPQVALYELLKKYDGRTEREYKTWKDLFLKKFELRQLPPYLIVVIKRISKNNFFLEKVRARASVMVIYHDMGLPSLTYPPRPSALTFASTLAAAAPRRSQNPTIVNFPIVNLNLAEYLSAEVAAKHPSARYNLIANIVHEGDPKPGAGTYRVHVEHRVSCRWRCR